MHTCPHLQTTRLQPPFFSTWFWHLGQGFVLVLSQLAVSLSSLHRLHLQLQKLLLIMTNT